MKINIFDLIDFERINTLLEGFNKTTGFVTALLDLEGRILSKSGWRNVCVDFHRVNHLSTKNCHTSDTVLASKMASGEKYHFYNCLNGLVDVAVPVVVNGEHIANLFSGQFFFEPPNMTYFTAQARRFGFDETKYIQQVKEVPVLTAEKVKTAMEFLLNMTELVAQMTVQRLEQLEMNEALQQKQLQLEAQNQQLQLAREKAEKSNQMHSSMLRTSMDGFWLLDMQMNILEVSDAYIKMIGYTENELLNMKVTDVEAKETTEETSEHFQNIVTTGFDRFVTKHRRKDGTTFDCEITAQYKPIESGQVVEFIRDITDRVKAREEIERSERILRLFVEHSPASIAMFDRQMHYIIASRRYLQDYGLGEQVLTGRSHYDVFPDMPKEWESIHQRVMAGEIIRNDKDPFPRADGTLEWVRWELHPWYESEEQVGGVILFSEVITGQVEAEMELRESEKYNRMLFEQSVIGLALSTLEGHFLDVNSTFADIIGYSIEEARQLTYWELTPESYREKEAVQFDDLMIKGKYGPYEKEFIHKDGHLVPVRLQGSILERNGQRYIWSGVEDITERKRAEEALERSEKEFRTLAESMPQIVWIAAPDGLNIYFNHRWVDYTGLSLEESYGEGWVKPFHPEDQAKAWKAWKKALAGKGIYSIECRLRRHDGVYRRWLIRGVPVLDDWGIIIKWFGTYTDIEEIKEAEDKIKEQLDELRRWHEVTIDREERILELKREVNDLQTAKGLPVRYGRFSNPLDQE